MVFFRPRGRNSARSGIEKLEFFRLRDFPHWSARAGYFGNRKHSTIHVLPLNGFSCNFHSSYLRRFLGSRCARKPKKNREDVYASRTQSIGVDVDVSRCSGFYEWSWTGAAKPGGHEYCFTPLITCCAFYGAGLGWPLYVTDIIDVADTQLAIFARDSGDSGNSRMAQTV